VLPFDDKSFRSIWQSVILIVTGEAEKGNAGEQPFKE
jgi:hypothetical protein